jgi:hypothetical protein
MSDTPVVFFNNLPARVLIRSIARSSGNSSNFTLSFTNTTFPQGKYTLLSIMMPNTFFGTVTGVNDHVYFTTTGSNLFTAIIPQGTYNVNNFQTILISSMNSSTSNNPTFTSSYSTTTNAFTISVSSGQFAFLFGTNTSESARYSLGFSNTDGTLATSQTSNIMVQLSFPFELFISMSEGTQLLDQTSSTGLKGWYLVADCNFGNFIDYQIGSYVNQSIWLNSTSTLTIQILNPSGSSLSNNGAEWSMLLQRDSVNQNYVQTTNVNTS